MSILTIEVEPKDSVNVVKLKGVINADTSPILEEKLDELIEVDVPNLLMDMTEATYISSAGIGSFIGVIKQIRRKKGDLRFAKTSSKVKRVFSLLDMNDFFQFFSSVEDGITSFDKN
jgi:anti-sigma B factor antagonist